MPFRESLQHAVDLGREDMVSTILDHAEEILNRHAPGELRKAFGKTGDNILRRAFWETSTDEAVRNDSEFARLLDLADKLPNIYQPAGRGEFFSR